MRAAVVGTNWGAMHVAALRDAGVAVVAVAGADARRTAAAAVGLGVPSGVTDLTELADMALDVITVATPATTHVWVINALPDVPVLCDKPAVGTGRLEPLVGRASPVWVNYAFPVLETARRAAAALPHIGEIQSARARADCDLASDHGPVEWFFEVATPPWSWLVTVLGGDIEAGLRAADSGPEVVVVAVCGGVPVRVCAARRPGIDGIRYALGVTGARGEVRLSGRYRVGQPWVYGPVVRHSAVDRRELGPREVGPPDPWQRANGGAVWAFVEALCGGPRCPDLLSWQQALDMDRCAGQPLGLPG